MFAGSPSPVGLATDHRSQYVRHRGPRRTDAVRSGPRTTRSRTTRCRFACRAAGRAPAPGSCTRQCPESFRSPSRRRGRWQTVGAHRRRSLGETEVEHLGVAVARDRDVRRLEVAVDDALVMRGVQRIGDLPSQRRAPRRTVSGPRAIRSARVPPSTSSRTRNAPTWCRLPRRRRWRRYSDGSARRAPAPRARTARGDPRRQRRRRAATLTATSRPSRVSRAR